MTSRMVLATGNAHKVRELRALLAGRHELGGCDLEQAIIGLDQVPNAPEVVEDGTTFAANALLKARALCALTGLPALADDSGLSVDVLGGAPGIFSARWSGRHGDDAANVKLLLAQLGDVRQEDRGAQFDCAAALVAPDGTEIVHQGSLRGVLAREPRGSAGFGYDPIFLVGERTLAEHTAAEKNAISHRSRAMAAMAPELCRYLA